VFHKEFVFLGVTLKIKKGSEILDELGKNKDETMKIATLKRTMDET